MAVPRLKKHEIEQYIDQNKKVSQNISKQIILLITAPVKLFIKLTNSYSPQQMFQHIYR